MTCYCCSQRKRQNKLQIDTKMFQRDPSRKFNFLGTTFCSNDCRFKMS